MTDIVGITSAIDHIVYMLLNTIATLLWRLDAAIISMSLYSYGTQDWLTGNSGGGVWGVLEWLIGPGGLAGVTTWTLFGSLALMLWGMAKIAKPFISFQPVDIGKLIIFFVLSYVVISQGTSLMPAIEAWRVGAGSVVYEAISSSGDAVIEAPAAPATSDPLGSPADLDGTGVIRGWEAVATTYFLVTTPEEIHRSYPPDDFLQAYCLYNPELAINTQAVTNAAGCSPRLAWDEWDTMSIDILRDSYGIDLSPILTPVQEFFGWFGITFDFTSLITMIPVTRHHPENRELGIRQAQSGIARLAMGIIVSIFPMIEANISLLLALAASFIYLTLPIALLFGFFLPTESIVNRLFMQFAAVVMRTIIIQGMVALFMLILMNTAATGSLSAYIGLVGVGLIGGWVLLGVATSTMKETFSQSMGAVSSIWMGSTTGLLGQGAAAPAAAALGAAKLAGGGALLATAAWSQGAGAAWSLSDPVSDNNRSGMGDLRAGSPGAAAFIEKQRGRLPDSLHRLTSQLGLATGPEAQAAGMNGVDPLTLVAAPLELASQLGLAAGIGAADQRQASTGSRQQNENGGRQRDRQSLYPSTNPLPTARRGAAAALLPAAAASFTAGAGMMTGANPSEARQRRHAAVDQWVGQSYKARETGTGQRRAAETGRDLLGEELAWKAERAMERHAPAEVNTVVAAARAAAEEGKRGDLVQNGRLTRKAVEEVQRRLDPETAQAFQGEKGAWDLAALTAVGLQEQKQAEPDQFRQAMAGSKSGWGEDSPAHTVPKELGLDPVAAGSHYTAMNRFARLADDAHLSEKQRERLLKEAQSGQVSDKTREELEKTIAEQQKQGRAQGLTAEALIAGASAVPATIAGPEQVWTTPAKPAQVQGGQDAAEGALLGIELKRGQKGKKEQETGRKVPASTAGDTVGVAATEIASSGPARTTTAAAVPVSAFSGLTGSAESQTGERRGGRATAGEGSAMIGPSRPGIGDDQDSGRPGQVIEPMVAAPTMASRSRGTGTGDPTLPPETGRGSRHLGQELKGQAHAGEGALPVTQQPGATGSAPPTDVGSNMETPVGVSGQIFSAGGESARSTQGSGFGQELKTEATDQALESAPIGGTPVTDSSPADSAFGATRIPMGGGAAGPVEPAADIAANVETPVGVSSQTFSANGEPAQATRSSGFGQELRAELHEPTPTGWTGPAAAEPFAGTVTNIDAPAGAGDQVFYPSSGFDQPGGLNQEFRPTFPDQDPLPPPVSSPPPAAVNPPVDSTLAAARAPISHIAPDWARPPLGETFRQAEPLNTPPITPAPATGGAPVMQYNTDQPATSTTSAALNPGYGSSGGFGQELHQMASVPPQPPQQPVRQPIASATGGPPVVESMAPPPRINPAPAASGPPVPPPNISQPVANPPTPPPARGQGDTPPSPQPSQRQRRGGGITAPVQPPPARPPGAATTPPSAATPPTQTQNISEPKKGPSRSGGKKEKGTKG